jgi:hypothetical protein
MSRTSEAKTEEAILQEIEIEHKNLMQGRMNALQISLKLGRLFLDLKPIVRQKGGKFEDYMKRKVSYLTLRTIQRYMKLAKNVNLEKYPALKWFGQVRLYELTTIAKAKDLGKFLETKGIDCKIQTDRKENLKVLMDKIDVLIEKPGSRKGKPPQKGAVESFHSSYKSFNQKLDGILQSDGLRKINLSEMQQLEGKIRNLVEKREALTQGRKSVEKEAKP